MPIPTGGFAGVEIGFEPMPSGTYTAKVAKGEVRVAGEDAKYPGEQYIAWEFDITEEGYQDRKQWVNTSLVPKAKPLLKQFLIGVGYTEEELDSETFEIDIDEIEGREVKLVLVQGTNPRTQERNNSVRRVLPMTEEESELP